MRHSKSPAGSIFICYRRDDSADIAGRIYDRLVAEFGKQAIFRDVDTIPYGVDFREHVQKCLKHGSVGLVVIGPDWLEIAGTSGAPRLHEEADHVRLEIEGMMARKELITIPLYVGGSHPPSASALPDSLKELAFRNGADIRRDPDFHHDMDRLVAQIREILEQQREAARRQAAPAPKPADWEGILGGLFSLAIFGLMIWGAVTVIPKAWNWAAAKLSSAKPTPRTEFWFPTPTALPRPNFGTPSPSPGWLFPRTPGTVKGLGRFLSSPTPLFYKTPTPDLLGMRQYFRAPYGNSEAGYWTASLLHPVTLATGEILSSGANVQLLSEDQTTVTIFRGLEQYTIDQQAVDLKNKRWIEVKGLAPFLPHAPCLTDAG